MDVKIGDRWMDVVANAIESGRFTSTDDVVQEGLRLVAEREDAFRRLKAKIDRSIERGGQIPHDAIWSELHHSIDKVFAAKAA